MFATVGIVLLSLLGVALLWTALSLVLDAVRARRFDEKVQGRHVLVTGGSKGLGLCVALEFARRGANVTVVARSEKELGEAKALLEAASTATGKVQALRCDVTDEAASLRTIEEAERALGPVFVLCTCAGSALTGYFLGAPADRFRRSFDLNYFGTLNFVRPVATRMAAAGAGHIVVVSSALALTAYQGYSAYTPTKWALRALCDTLRSELEPYGVAVHSAYPPGMDTPGYAVEQLTKTAECQEIERGQKLHKPALVAAALVASLARGRYHLACGDFDNALLVSMAAGMSPRTWPLLDIVTAPFILIISFFVSAGWASTVNNAKFASVRPNPRELLDAARRRPSSVDEAKAE